MTHLKVIKELEKIEEVIKVGVEDLDKRKNYDEAKRFLVGIKIAIKTLIDKNKL